MTLSRTGVSAQVGLARRESPSRGARLANASLALVQHLHHTLDALAAGVLNERRAEIVVRCTSHLDPELRTQVDSEVVGAHLDLTDPTAPGGVGSWGDRELERRVRACADRLDAAAAVERCRVAERERRVTIRPVPDAMAVVSALLPVAQAVAVHTALTRAALSGKAAGDDRGKGQLMADTLVELVTGQAMADDVPVEVQVVMTDRALLAGDDMPVHVPGYGPVPARWARELLAPGPSEDRPGDVRANVWVRRLFTHPTTGSLVAMDSTRRLFPAALRRFVVARDGTCRTPWCDAAVAHADHVQPHAEGGPTSAANGQGLCVRCNLVKEEPGWTSEVLHDGLGLTSAHPHTVRTTTPTGHRYASSAPPLLPMRPPGSPPRAGRRAPPCPPCPPCPPRSSSSSSTGAPTSRSSSSADVVEHELHPRRARQREAGTFVDATPVGSGGQVHAISVDRARPLDHVADEKGPEPAPAMLRHGDDVGEPHGAAARAVRVGYAELERADRRRDDDAVHLDHREASDRTVIDDAYEPVVRVPSPGGTVTAIAVTPVVHERPEGEQSREIGRRGGPQPPRRRVRAVAVQKVCPVRRS